MDVIFKYFYLYCSNILYILIYSVHALCYMLFLYFLRAYIFNSIYFLMVYLILENCYICLKVFTILYITSLKFTDNSLENSLILQMDF